MERLRAAALAYPGAKEEFPWGDRVVKVGGKIFVWVGVHEGKLGVTAKLPDSAAMALMFPFAEPTGYGLGKAGWVSARFGPDDEVPEAMLLEWIMESYRAVAPRKLAAQIGLLPEEAPAAKKPVAKKAPAKKTAAKKVTAKASADKAPVGKAPPRKTAAKARKATRAHQR